MSENIIRSKNVIIISNGGDPLSGCPKNWNDAYAWIDRVNKNKNEHYEPKWKFDCGFKLDYDGPILSVTSRFYPPKTHYGDKWDGAVEILFFGKCIYRRRFEEDTLDDLRYKVESFVREKVKENIIETKE